MKRAFRIFATVGPVVMLGTSLSGCTLVFSTIGGAMDNATKRDGYSVPARPESLPAGGTVTLMLRDGKTADGTCDGMVRLPDSVYAEELAVSRRTLPVQTRFPLPGDTLRLTRTYGSSFPALFTGYSRNALMLFNPGARRDAEVPFTQLRHCENMQGAAYPLDALAELCRSGQLPPVMGIGIHTDSLATVLPLDRIQNATLHVPRHRTHFKTAGLVGGIMVDTTILIIMIAHFSHYDSGSFMTLQ